ncbi:unnamed protein product [Hermetia illucens]|uniref:GRIP domain-containing protein n=1 Tax=Hermetia illucens TaxID=343691 RepID=A0A7R8UEE4_HERIL|nr:golgin subfamily A member 4-like [Hermetia illucens]CAD7078442.1 unnamed protein product [Hermetia illucens]
MFANLKNKIFEEVKASPQKFQQFAQAAQAAVSSASSNASDSVSGSDNFFSITEEDTPQNSPHRAPASGSLKKAPTPSSSKQSNPIVSFANNGVTLNRTRRLSNSSMASDVSFRLPSYDSPAIYHLQSDLDISASEVEDSATPSNVQLDVISKEQLYSAYKKSLERYQKYRSRFTDLAKRYRDLERDSAKARSVLVETQDKAIRRISELREQCSLEQQAKAHLEEALRLEMDDMQCKLKAYETKLTLLGENPENVTNSAESKPPPTEESLIQLDSEDDNATSSASGDKMKNNVQSDIEDPSIQALNEKILKLEELVVKYKKQLSETSNKLQEISKENLLLTTRQQESDVLISNLKKREEENSILLAENKLMVHTELENKESEVKQLKQKLAELERNASQDQLIAELRHQIAEKDKVLENLKKQHSEHDQKFSQLEKENKELKLIQSRKAELEKELENVAKQLTELQVLLDSKKEMEERVKKENDDFRAQIAHLEKELHESRAESEASQNHIKELKAEIEGVRIVAKSQESAAIGSLQNELKELKETYEEKLKSLQDALVQKEETCKQLEKDVAELKTAIDTSTNEQVENTSSSAEECRQLREQIEKLKSDHTDREIQMEKEKLELQSQVTNILQEISRMEDQMKDVRRSHDQLEEEKRVLEKKIEKMTRQNQVSQEGQQKWQVMLQEAESNAKQLEAKLKEAGAENTQLAEKNCLQAENLKRFEMQIKESESSFKREKQSLNNIIKEAEVNYSSLRLELDTANETIRKLNEKMSQVLDENSSLHNAKELMDHEFRSLQDQCESREKEKLCVLDNNKCLEEEVQRLKRETEELRSSSGDDKEQLRRLLDEINTLKDCKAQLEQQIKSYEAEANSAKSAEEHLQQLHDECTKSNEEILRLKEKILKLNSQIQEIQQREEKCSKEFSDRIDEINKENITLKKQNESYSAEINQLNSRTESRLEELQSLLKRANEEKEVLKETIKNASDLEKKLQNYEEQKIENQYLNTSINQLETNMRNLKDEQAQKDKEIAELKEKIKSQQCELYVQIEEKDKHQVEINVLNEKLTKESEETNKLQEILTSEREELKRQKDQVAFITNENDKLQQDLLSWQQKASDNERISGERRLKLEELTNENTRLKTDLEDAKVEFKQNYSQLSEENEKHKTAVRNLTEQLTSIGDQLTKLETLEANNQQLQLRIKELEVELVEKAKVKSESVVESSKQQQSEMEVLRNINERLQRELEDLKHKTSAEIMNLTHECDDLAASAKAMSEKVAEYDKLQEQYRKLMANMQTPKDDNANESDAGIEAIRKEKEDLEVKLEKIMHEVQDVSNRNLFLEQKCENYLVLEQSNERLKLANDKLSRQLDETLVSLQHHEGISANTEFEYLRNIMFQYLTGSVTGNNSTLVKVIAAVLKFTPQQTQVAIEKEHQRHTLAGQISNLL